MGPIHTNPYANFSIVQATRQQTQLNESEPASDNVLDLTQSEQLSSELTSQTADNTHFLRLQNQQGQDLFLSLERLQSAQIKQLIDDLKSRALDPNNQLKANFNLDEFIQVSGQDVRVGAGQPEVDPYLQKAPIDRATSVIERSNSNPDDAYWSFSNGTSNSLSFQNRTDKPAPWNNHLFVSGDKAFIYQTSSDQRTTPLPNEQKLEITSEQAAEQGLPEELIQQLRTQERQGETPSLRYIPQTEYQQMLKADFNFNGAFSEFQSADQFYSALANTYPERLQALGPDNFRQLSDRIYSYASQSQDTDGQIDVAEMQGLLYALDPEIRMSSNSNTPMQAQTLFQLSQSQFEALPPEQKGNYARAGDGHYVPLSITADQYNSLGANDQAKFTPLGDRFVPLGDNKHGRATILTTRHIMENARHGMLTPEPIEFSFRGVFSDKDRFVRDTSTSMNVKWEQIYPAIDRVLQQQGVLEQNQSLNNNMDVSVQQSGRVKLFEPASGENLTVNGATTTYDEMNRSIADFSNVLTASYAELYPENTPDNRRDFAELLGVEAGQIFDSNGRLDGDKLMKELGDIRNDSDHREYGATGEAGLKGVLIGLLFDPDYQNHDGTRMNVVLDEPIQDLEYLRLAQKLAEAREVDVRFVVVPKDPSLNFRANPQAEMVFIDLNSMQVSYQEGQPSKLSYVSTTIDASGNPVSQPLDKEIKYFGSNERDEVHNRRIRFDQRRNGFQGAYVPLIYNAEGKPLSSIAAGTE